MYPLLRRLLSRAALPRALFCCGLLVHLLFLLSLHFGWLNGLFNDSAHRFGPGADFFSIYAAGRKARIGASLYTLGGVPDDVPYAYAFRYAPLVAYTLGWALSLLPALTALGVWLVLCEWTLLRNIRLTFEHAPDRATGYVAASLWLLFSPYYLELYAGQFTFVAASLVFWAFLAWSPRAKSAPSRLSAWLGDGAFTLGVWLKLMPLVFLPVALLRGRLWSALSAVGILLLTSWLYFAHWPSDWVTFLAINAAPLPTWHAGNQGLMALAFGLLNQRTASFLVFYRISVSAGCALLLWLSFRAWQARPRPPANSGGAATLRLLGFHPRPPYPEGTRNSGGAAALRLLGLNTPSTARTEPVEPEPTPAFEYRLLLLYAAGSAAYLLLYKDVWEHHYVLLLPPLALLALCRAPAGLWLPSFAIAALPTLFALYDVRGLGFNEDPQGYWRPAVSLLQHGLKPISALWLLAGVAWQGLPTLRTVAWPKAAPAWRRRFVACLLAAPLTGCGIAGALWAGAAISQQRRGGPERVWTPPLFQTQKRANTCGPAALASVCRHYGIPAEEEEIASLAGCTEAGTSMLGLQRAAQLKGLTALGRKVALEELPGLPLPCILYFHPGHFAVLTGFDHGRFLLADPRSGQQSWTARELGRLWRGELLIVGPGETPAPRHSGD